MLGCSRPVRASLRTTAHSRSLVKLAGALLLCSARPPTARGLTLPLSLDPRRRRNCRGARSKQACVRRPAAAAALAPSLLAAVATAAAAFWQTGAGLGFTCMHIPSSSAQACTMRWVTVLAALLLAASPALGVKGWHKRAITAAPLGCAERLGEQRAADLLGRWDLAELNPPVDPNLEAPNQALFLPSAELDRQVGAALHGRGLCDRTFAGKPPRCTGMLQCPRWVSACSNPASLQPCSQVAALAAAGDLPEDNLQAVGAGCMNGLQMRVRQLASAAASWSGISSLPPNRGAPMARPSCPPPPTAVPRADGRCGQRHGRRYQPRPLLGLCCVRQPRHQPGPGGERLPRRGPAPERGASGGRGLPPGRRQCGVAGAGARCSWAGTAGLAGTGQRGQQWQPGHGACSQLLAAAGCRQQCGVVPQLTSKLVPRRPTCTVAAPLPNLAAGVERQRPAVGSFLPGGGQAHRRDGRVQLPGGHRP